MKVTTKQLKTLIKDKFGNARRFCILTGQDRHYHSIRRLLNNRDLSEYGQVIVSMQFNIANAYNDAFLPSEINDLEREYIVESIKYWHKNVHRFCEENSFVPVSSLYDITRGRIKKKNKVFHEVMNILLSKKNGSV